MLGLYMTEQQQERWKRTGGGPPITPACLYPPLRPQPRPMRDKTLQMLQDKDTAETDNFPILFHSF